MIRSLFFTLAILFAGTHYSNSHSLNALYDSTQNEWAYKALSIPSRKLSDKARPIVVAVVDDGFRLNHIALKGLVYTNTKEIPGNLLDDDFNGYIDDVEGWDISDNDPDVTLPKGRENTFYHGTYVASIIGTVFTKCYGIEESKRHLQILPVKVLAAEARNNYLADGYKGILYAINQGADIICCAWSGGSLTLEQQKILSLAVAKGILLVGSAGNFYSEKTEGLPSFPEAWAIAGLDSTLQKTSHSNYGMRIDLACPGSNVRGAHSSSDDAYFTYGGTSPAAALATGCAAVLKATYPNSHYSTLLESLKNTAQPLDSINPRYCGKLGAGLPNLSKAFTYLGDAKKREKFFSPSRPEGKVIFSPKGVKERIIHPYGDYKSIRLFHPSIQKEDGESNVHVYGKDSLYFQGSLETLKKGVLIPGNMARIVLFSKKGTELNYFVETIDSTALFCKNTEYIESEKGTITDGSGEKEYANSSSCKWQITAPTGKRIQLDCSYLDTEPNVDFVWIFDGNATIPENLIAKLSGNSLPPSITSRSSEVLIWFVTNGHKTGKGWQLDFTLK